MLKPIMHKLANKRIILASGSPRRQELIRNIGLTDVSVDLVPSLFEENLKPTDFPSVPEFVEETALQKVLEVSKRLSTETNNRTDNSVFIGADTVVEMAGKIYGKPKTAEKAFTTLCELIDNGTCTVYTGVVIKFNERIVKFTEQAKVNFGNVTKEQIQGYVDTGEPLDKAGGFGIQGVGGTLISGIEGDYFTVTGMPLYRLTVELCKLFGYPK